MWFEFAFRLLYSNIIYVLLLLNTKFITTVYSGTIITSNGTPGPNNTLLYSEGVPIFINCTTDTGQLHWGSSITKNTSYSAIDPVPSESSMGIFDTWLLSVDQNTMSMISRLTAQNSSAVFGSTVMCWDKNDGPNLSAVTIRRMDSGTSRPPSPTSSTASPSYPTPSFPYRNTSLVLKLSTGWGFCIPGINGTLVSSTLATVKGLNNLTYNISIEEGCGWVIGNVSSNQDLTVTTPSCVGAQNISISVYYSDEDTSYVKTYWTDQCHTPLISNISNITAIRITCTPHSSPLGQGMPTWQKALIGVGMGAIGVCVMLAVLCASALCTKKGKRWLRKLWNKVLPQSVQDTQSLPTRTYTTRDLGTGTVTYIPEESIHSLETEDAGGPVLVHFDQRSTPMEVLPTVTRNMYGSPETRANSPPLPQYHRGSVHATVYVQPQTPKTAEQSFST